MNKYITSFTTTEEFNASKSSLKRPHVSLTKDDMKVHYMPYDYSDRYLTFEALENGTFQFTKVINYSTDGGTTWTELAANTATPTITSGNKIMWKATLTPNSSTGIGTFSSTTNFNVQGNAMSLLFGDDFKGQTSLTGKSHAFRYLFSGCTKAISAKNLSLPTTTLATYCYSSMFRGCTSLTTAPELPATTLANYCYGGMFRDCTSLTTAPQLPATTLINDCYSYMFYNCTSLTTAPQLSATTLADNCYESMFRGCTSLTTAPQLPATTLAGSCYYSMFQGCTNLTTAPELSATTLAGSCYRYIFSGCTCLTTAPQLPATTLASNCYYGMFQHCTSLTTAPELPAITLVSNCYKQLFSGCTRLNYIKAMFTTAPSETYTSNWVSEVASSGTFVKNDAAKWDVIGNDGIPTGWTVVNYYSNQYLTFEALEDGTFQFTNAINYSIDNGTTWTSLAANTATPTITASNKIMWKATLTPSSSNPQGIGTFSSTGNFNVEGNPISLLYGDNFIGQTDLTSKNYAFYYLFYNCSKLINAKNLSLPATTLASACYEYMFQYCTSLTTAPKLPATTLADYCYSSMFYYCTSLTTAPELPATTLANYCYYAMFSDCTSLTTAPDLPATTLAYYCYGNMFNGCTSLATAPELSATTLATYCYQSMLAGCTSLTTAPQLPATTLAEGCYGAMFSNCTSLTTVPELNATTLAIDCYGNMFQDCTSLTTAPELNATTLANNCYRYMFYGCTSLTAAPELPATTLASGCYKYMFFGCTKLNYIKAMFTTTPSSTYTDSWVKNVASTGTFVKNSAATWNVTGVNGVPTGWTVQTVSS